MNLVLHITFREVIWSNIWMLYEYEVLAPVQRASMLWAEKIPPFDGLQPLVMIDWCPRTHQNFELSLSVESVSVTRKYDVTCTIGSVHSVRSILEYSNICLKGDLYFQTPVEALLEPNETNLRIKFRISRLNRQSMKDEDKIATDEYVGLPNQGATCYMNSFLQCLFHLPLFRKTILSTPREHFRDNKQERVVASLQHLFWAMQIKDKKVNTRELTDAFGWQKVDTWIPQDVAEFGKILFDQLLPSSIEMFKITVRTVEIESGFHNDEVICELPLIVKGCSSVKESLDLFVAPKFVDESLQTHRFMKLPMILMFHLARFDVGANDSVKKLNSYYEFTEDLDLSEHAPECAPAIYRLFAVIVHYGGLNAGHYWVMIKRDDIWYEFNDRKVSIVTDEAAVKRNFGGGGKSYGAYVLVYTRALSTHEIFCEVPESVVQPYIKEMQWPVRPREKTPPSQFMIITEDALALNARRFRISMLHNDAKKFITLSSGTSFKTVYQTVSELCHKDPKRIRIWTTNPHTGTIHRPVEITEKVNKNLSKSLFVQYLKTQKSEQSSITVFLYFYIPGDSPSLQYLGTHDVNSLSKIQCLYDVINQRMGFARRPQMRCYLLMRDAAKRVNDVRSFIDLALITGASLCFQIDYEVDVMPAFTFRIESPEPPRYNTELPMIDLCGDTGRAETIEDYFNAHNNVYITTVSHFTLPEVPVMNIKFRSAHPIHVIREAIAEACGSHAALVLYTRGDYKRPLEDLRLYNIPELVYLIFNDLSPQEYQESMQIMIRAKNTRMEIPVREGEALQAVVERLKCAAIIDPALQYRVFRSTKYQIVEEVFHDDVVLNDAFMLHFEAELRSSETEIFVATAVIRSGEISCFGSPFITHINADDTAQPIKAQLSQIISSDLKFRLAVSDFGIRFLDNEHSVFQQMCGEKHLFLIFDNKYGRV